MLAGRRFDRARIDGTGLSNPGTGKEPAPAGSRLAPGKASIKLSVSMAEGRKVVTLRPS